MSASFIIYGAVAGNVKVLTDLLGVAESATHVQYLKLMDGALGGTQGIPGDATNGMDVDVTRVIPGVAINSLGKQINGAYIPASTGVQVLGVRKAVLQDSEFIADDGKYSPFVVDASGALWVSTGTTRPVNEIYGETAGGNEVVEQGHVMLAMRNDDGTLPLGNTHLSWSPFQLDENLNLKVTLAAGLLVPNTQQDENTKGFMLLAVRNDRLATLQTGYGQSDGATIINLDGHTWNDVQDIVGPPDGTTNRCDVTGEAGQRTDRVFLPFTADTPQFEFTAGESVRGVRLTLYLGGWNTDFNVPAFGTVSVALSLDEDSPVSAFRTLRVNFGAVNGFIVPVIFGSLDDTWGMSAAALKAFLEGQGGLLFHISKESDDTVRYIADAVQFDVGVDSAGLTEFTGSQGDLSPVAVDSRGRVQTKSIPENGLMTIGPDTINVKQAIVNVAASGETTILNGVSGKKFRVIGMLLMAEGDVGVSFLSNTGGAEIFPIMPLAENAGFQAFWERGYLCQTTTNAHTLRIKLSAAVPVRGVINYLEV